MQNLDLKRAEELFGKRKGTSKKRGRRERMRVVNTCIKI
jgi:hypothetical protein